jgi:hypothetical protein
MKYLITIILLTFFLISCTNTIKEPKTENNTFINKRLELSKTSADDILGRHDPLQIGGNFALHEHIRRIESIILKIEQRKNSTDKINFKEEYNFFNWTERYDASFFKKSNMPPLEALYIIDKLLLEIRNSDLANDFYKYEIVEFDFKQINNELTFDYRLNQMMLKSYFIGPVDSCTNDHYIEHHIKRLEDFPIDLSDYKKGDTITGGIAMKKMNYPEMVSFKYIKQ